MSKNDVICPGCGGAYHEVNDEYTADRPANATMFTLKEQWRDAGWSDFPKDESVGYGNLTCPNCETPYCTDAGHLVHPPKVESDFVCKECGKVCKTESGLQKHMAAKHGTEQ